MLRTETSQFELHRSFTRLRGLFGELHEARHDLKKNKTYARALKLQKVEKEIELLASRHRNAWIVI
jgi:hypothetical protein